MVGRPSAATWRKNAAASPVPKISAIQSRCRIAASSSSITEGVREGSQPPVLSGGRGQGSGKASRCLEVAFIRFVERTFFRRRRRCGSFFTPRSGPIAQIKASREKNEPVSGLLLRYEV
jgi:hypothetical protein